MTHVHTVHRSMVGGRVGGRVEVVLFPSELCLYIGACSVHAIGIQLSPPPPPPLSLSLCVLDSAASSAVDIH